jgi:hypothetical protein
MPKPPQPPVMRARPRWQAIVAGVVLRAVMLQKLDQSRFAQLCNG